MEERILRYYLKIFSIFTIIFFLCFSSYIFYLLNKKIILNTNQLKIEKGDGIENVIKKNIYNYTNFDLFIIKNYFKIDSLINNSFIHYGEFNVNYGSSVVQLIETISEPSNVFNKITIIEGWSQKQLNLELSKYFKDFHPIPYQNVIADTYLIQKDVNFHTFKKKINDTKNNYFKSFKNNKLLNQFNDKEIMIIGSLLEKEALGEQDKKLISSVILNRLNKNMKLQIDATVIFSITNGDYNLERKLLLSDLKIDHPYNTYLIKGLPPQPISYVGKKTLDIIFANFKSDFLFYFFDNSLNRHIFSKNFKEHKYKLNEYRNK